MTKRVWVFDLDDTLHNASAHIFPVMNRAMTQYIQNFLNLEEPDACALRQHYWKVYGATLKGLMRHHGVNPHHFLSETHAFLEDHMVQEAKRLRYFLTHLPGRKCVFTNAPKHYALRVLDVLGIQDCFELIFSVESSKFHAKPSVRGFQMLLKNLRVDPRDCVMLEDSLPALKTAKRLGMRTIWVTKKLQKPNFVDHRINSVLALTYVRV
jgi:putative hydrolase of the HAD superfamily